jgi:hypothetical protein
VSPLWRDEIGAHLSPRRLCVVRAKRGVKPTLGAEHEEEFEFRQLNDWTAALQALDNVLTQPAWRGAPLRVVVADSWVRYAIVPWVAELSSGEERVTHARQLLASAYGDAVSDWEVRLSEAPPGSPRVACTIPVALLEGVRTVCAKQQVKLLSMQPQLVAAYDGWRHRLPSVGAWFVTVDEGSMAAARIGRTGWDRVYTVRLGADWARELKRLQTFGRLASASSDEGQVFVDAPEAWRAVVGASAQHLQWLEADASADLTTLQRLGRLRRFAA